MINTSLLRKRHVMWRSRTSSLSAWVAHTFISVTSVVKLSLDKWATTDNIDIETSWGRMFCHSRVKCYKMTDRGVVNSSLTQRYRIKVGVLDTWTTFRCSFRCSLIINQRVFIQYEPNFAQLFIIRLRLVKRHIETRWARFMSLTLHWVFYNAIIIDHIHPCFPHSKFDKSISPFKVIFVSDLLICSV